MVLIRFSEAYLAADVLGLPFTMYLKRSETNFPRKRAVCCILEIQFVGFLSILHFKDRGNIDVSLQHPAIHLYPLIICAVIL